MLRHVRLTVCLIVLGHIAYAHERQLPDCRRMLRQPCRPNEEAVPSGVGPLPPL